MLVAGADIVIRSASVTSTGDVRIASRTRRSMVEWRLLHEPEMAVPKNTQHGRRYCLMDRHLVSVGRADPLPHGLVNLRRLQLSAQSRGKGRKGTPVCGRHTPSSAAVCNGRWRGKLIKWINTAVFWPRQVG
jgi:hypothetical protein